MVVNIDDNKGGGGESSEYLKKKNLSDRQYKLEKQKSFLDSKTSTIQVLSWGFFFYFAKLVFAAVFKIFYSFQSSVVFLLPLRSCRYRDRERLVLDQSVNVMLSPMV